MSNSKYILIVLVTFLTSCAIVRPGEVGIKQRMGKLSDEVISMGTIGYNPIFSRVVKVPVNTRNLELVISLPSKEGLSIVSQISILYRLEPDKVPTILRNIGFNSESIISSVFRSASADVCSKYFAKDMHSGMRAEIELEIQKKMGEILIQEGIITEAVLMKSIQLPDGLARSIEQKLQAEQDALRMEFILKQAKLDAERKLIEATGTRDAQKVIAEGLTDQIIKIRSIEAFQELSKSPNTKIIVTDGKTPFLIQQ